MIRFKLLLAAGATIGGLAGPAAAQYQYPQQYPVPYPPQQYPGYPTYPGDPNYPGYPTYPGQQYGGNNVIGSIIDGLIGNRYNVSDRQAIRQCTFAAVSQAENQYRPYFGQNFRRPYQGYDGYIRVTQITDVSRRSNGRVRVRGLLDSGLYRTQPYDNRYSGYGDLSFRCDVDFRGYVSNVRIERNDNYRRY